MRGVNASPAIPADHVRLSVAPMMDWTDSHCRAFHRVLADDAERGKSTTKLVKDSKIRRVVLCSGKVYYDLLDEREKRGIDDVYLMRVEQLYPFPLKTLAQELARFKEKHQHGEYQLFRGARKWLHHDEASLQEPQKQQLGEIFAHSNAVKTYYELRNELAGIWERSNASREQLLSQLQNWCQRAEQSGIHALQEFASRLRRYA